MLSRKDGLLVLCNCTFPCLLPLTILDFMWEGGISRSLSYCTFPWLRKDKTTIVKNLQQLYLTVNLSNLKLNLDSTSLSLTTLGQLLGLFSVISSNHKIVPRISHMINVVLSPLVVKAVNSSFILGPQVRLVRLDWLGQVCQVRLIRLGWLGQVGKVFLCW